jgi:pimeloyl-ACP methyl ester carboxylesterase
MVANGKVSWRTIGGEVAALGTAVLSMPLRWLVPDEHLDRSADDAPPVVFVHGFLGDPTNFIVLRRALGGRRFASFRYSPRFDHQGLAGELAEFIEGVCRATGEPQVDVVAHSLGGAVARYLVETGGGRRVRRLVTLGALYYTGRFPRNELAIFGAHDPIAAAPDPRQRRGRVEVVPECGHTGILYHPAVIDAVAAWLGRRLDVVQPAARRIISEAA